MSLSRLFLLLVSALVASEVFSDENRRNPFAHAPQPPPATAGSANTTEDGSPGMRVRAILVAGEDSLVSIDGELLAIGEVHRGFVLQAVREDAAVFVRNGETLTVGLFEPQESDDET